MSRADFSCFAWRIRGQWEATCLDLDISVQGASFDEIYGSLNEAVHTYVQDALALPEPDRSRLQARRAPLWVRAQVRLMFWLAAIRDTFGSDGSNHSKFPVSSAVA